MPSVTVRTNLRDMHGGSVLVEWAFPLCAKLRGYVQLFSGYGESLIDYNHRQTAPGFGVMLGDGI
jgi:phospholipase A1/A2